VIVWDEGWYAPALGDAKTKAEQEKQMLKDFYKGEIKIDMHGKKLKGRFALVRTKRGDNDEGKNWLLIKDRDEYATTKDIGLKDKSVKSGKTLEQVAKSKGSKLPGKATGRQQQNRPLRKQSARSGDSPWKQKRYQSPDAVKGGSYALHPHQRAGIKPGLSLRDQMGWLPHHLFYKWQKGYASFKERP
jgi:hypothetical protein